LVSSWGLSWSFGCGGILVTHMCMWWQFVDYGLSSSFVWGCILGIEPKFVGYWLQVELKLQFWIANWVLVLVIISWSSIFGCGLKFRLELQVVGWEFMGLTGMGCREKFRFRLKLVFKLALQNVVFLKLRFSCHVVKCGLSWSLGCELSCGWDGDCSWLEFRLGMTVKIVGWSLGWGYGLPTFPLCHCFPSLTAVDRFHFYEHRFAAQSAFRLLY